MLRQPRSWAPWVVVDLAAPHPYEAGYETDRNVALTAALAAADHTVTVLTAASVPFRERQRSAEEALKNPADRP